MTTATKSTKLSDAQVFVLQMLLENEVARLVWPFIGQCYILVPSAFNDIDVKWNTFVALDERGLLRKTAAPESKTPFTLNRYYTISAKGRRILGKERAR